ncbi:MAG: hypothetical protein M1827_006689 [Pycnora praestabilis]|nr:MAG: hypothetical protein M1827_006689 [Pycnora praestabilis]
MVPGYASLIALSSYAAFVVLQIAWIIWRKPKQSPRDMISDNDSTMAKRDLVNLAPYPQRPFNGASPFYMTMGLQKLDRLNWLIIDKEYLGEHTIRSDLLTHRKHAVLQCLRGSEDACAEVLQLVISFLTNRYPQVFEVHARGKDRSFVCNKATGEVFRIQPPYNLQPLEIATRLAMEDLNVLVRSESNGQHYLKASATLFPAGWHLQERIGWPVAKLHGLVPMWEEKLGSAVERFFSRITSDKPMERSSFFVQATTPEQPLSSILFHSDPFNTGDANLLKPEHVMIRRERQTFRRLPRSGAVLFTVKTSLTPLSTLGADDLRGFAKEVRAWPDGIAGYKGRDFWGESVLAYCDTVD